jgi:chromate transporter
MAGLIGYQRAKWSGLVVAELAFIIPSVVISSLLAMLYVRFGNLPQVSAIFYGINPVIVALILFAIWRLGKRTLASYVPVVIFGLAILAVILGVNEAMIIFGAGLLGMVLTGLPKLKVKPFGLISFIPILNLGLSGRLSSASSDNILLKLFLLFLKTGSLIFGTGLVLFAFIQSDIVDRLGWLTQQQLIDAIAVGQMTPGPVSSSAAFIGYLIAGWPGMLVASIGIFLPSFIIVSIIGPIIPKMRESLWLQAFLKGVNAAVLALMLSVGLTIAKSAIVDPWTLLILIASGLLLLLLKVDSFWLVLGGAVIGLLRFLL